MSSILNFPQVLLPEIFADHDAGSSACVTVITPNRRLATVLKREFNETRAVKGISAWDSADILPISAFIERIYEDALYSREASHLPILLTPVQEQVLWEYAVARSTAGTVLLSVVAAARLAREAWEIAHAWRLIPRLGSYPLNEDGKAFQEWSEHYEQMTSRAHQIDVARLCDLVSELCKSNEVAKPKHLVCHGFDIVTPQQAALLVRLEEA